MAKGGLLRRDWFIALAYSLLFLVAVVHGFRLLENLERVAYDTGIQAAHRNPGAVERIVVVTIDDDSIRKIGRWPWPRSVLAEMVEKLAAARAKLIGLQVFLSEPQTDPGLSYIRRIGSVLGKTANRGEVGKLLLQAEQELNTDRRLAEAIARAGNVILPMYFTPGQPLGKPDAPLPGFVQRNAVPRVVARDGNFSRFLPARAATTPLDAFGRSSAGIGHLNQYADTDGAIRTETLIVDYYGGYFPSLALVLAAKSLNLNTADITLQAGESVQLGNLRIATNAEQQMYTSFYQRPDGSIPFARYAFSDVRDGKVDMAQFENKIVLVGATGAGIGDNQVTPIHKTMDGPQLTAHTLASILNQDFYTRPFWALLAETGMFVAVALYLMFLLARMPAGIAALVSLGFMIALLAGGHYLLLREQVWLQTVSPAMMLLAGHVLLTTKHYFLTERAKVRVEADSAHTNRMLGLAFQNQGQLDMAMDKFRALPADASVLDLIYNLALDYERKRQFNKAAAAYDYILGHDAKFRDAAERRSRARQVDQTLILGGGRAGPGGTLILDQVDHKPTLGRYQVEKELGKGAMGAVYLGRDPRINRVVAIKTLALSSEFEGADLEQVRNRFFREAETAGRLSHPNIVTIYDAGEEHDLAYIAMEFLEGRDLTAAVLPDRLLPAPEVADIACKVAEALGYAHAQDVVHRDIKPANIMYDPRTHAIKVTDFGIARITASSRTRTGVVLGTPSYMSPEQLAGKRVDGRSDLFSLGVMTFQMLTGQLPFEGDSMTALMYQIANKPHPDIVALNPQHPRCLRGFFNKALAKDPARRFQTGTEFSQTLRDCLGTPGGPA
jgi:serine/threonine-protein kinase